MRAPIFMNFLLLTDAEQRAVLVAVVKELLLYHLSYDDAFM